MKLILQKKRNRFEQTFHRSCNTLGLFHNLCESIEIIISNHFNKLIKVQHANEKA